MKSKQAPTHPGAAAVGAPCPRERQGLSINPGEDPWGAFPPAPLSLCNSEQLSSGSSTAWQGAPFLGASLGQAVCSRRELQAQSIVHSPSCMAPWVWRGAASVRLGKGKLLPSLPQQLLCQPCPASGNTCVPTACPVLPGGSKLHENL